MALSFAPEKKRRVLKPFSHRESTAKHISINMHALFNNICYTMHITSLTQIRINGKSLNSLNQKTQEYLEMFPNPAGQKDLDPGAGLLLIIGFWVEAMLAPRKAR